MSCEPQGVRNRVSSFQVPSSYGLGVKVKGLKVATISLNGLILPIGGVSLGRVLYAACKAGLLTDPVYPGLFYKHLCHSDTD